MPRPATDKQDKPDAAPAPTSKKARKSRKKTPRTKADGEPFKRRNKRKWLAMIKKLQRTVVPAISNAGMDRCINDTAARLFPGRSVHFQNSARRAIHAAFEAKMHVVFDDTNWITARCRGAHGIRQADMQAAIRIGHKDLCP